MVDEPRPDVLAERIDGLGRRFGNVERRLDGLATKDELVALIQSRDELANQRIMTLTEDVKDLTAALATERAERQAADAAAAAALREALEKESVARQEAVKEVEKRSKDARAFALSAIGLGVTIVLALVALISQYGGAPA